MSIHDEKFGVTLKRLRDGDSLSRAELIKLLGNNITRSYIGAMELHDTVPSYEMILKLASVFSVNPNYLIKIARSTKIEQYTDKINRIYPEYGNPINKN